jgi:hypothetical protein
MAFDEKVKWTKEFCLCAHQELAEVMDSIDWKNYHMYAKEYSEKHTHEEIIDVIKFVMNIAIVWGMTPDMFVDIFNKKSDDVEKRLQLKSQIHE